MLFALFDQEYPRERLETEPELYRIGPRHDKFSFGKFWMWQGYGILQSALVFYVVFMTFNRTGGFASSIWVQGVAVYGAVVILVNTKVLYDTNSHSFLTLFFNFGSSATYFAYLWLMQHFEGIEELYGVFEPLMLYLGSTLVFLLWFMMVFPVESIIFQVETLMYRKRERRERRDAKRKQKAMREGVDPGSLGALRSHTGFAFSGEAGNAPAITSKLAFAVGTKLTEKLE